jgi:hypothetical protein
VPAVPVALALGLRVLPCRHLSREEAEEGYRYPKDSGEAPSRPAFGLGSRLASECSAWQALQLQPKTCPYGQCAVSVSVSATMLQR